MKRKYFSILLTVSLLLILTAVPVLAQTYYFSVDEEIVHVYWESDGSIRIEYILVITNDPSASPFDFVDFGLPNYNYDLANVYGWINDQPVQHVGKSEYVSPGIELGLQSKAIPPGATGEVKVLIDRVEGVLFDDYDDSTYTSAKFSPSWFGSQYVFGKTDLTVTFHLPPGVQPDEPRWHASPSGWPSNQPSTGLDSDGRVIYIWHNPSANAHTQYTFGASFPRSYVPSEVVSEPVPEGELFQPSQPSGRGITGTILVFMCFGGIILFIVGFVALAVNSDRRRKLAYLPPKLAIEGHGIKRGLTAIEAAVLLETPLDRVLTMILFSTIKKGATQVVSEDPLKIERITPQPKNLRPYEEDFLKAMIDETSRKRRTALQKVMVTMVKSVQKKMKGFSLRETKNYYQAIIKKAWQQVEQAATPEVRSKLYGEGLEWTMLDRDFDDRTRRVFRTGPVYVPIWWGRYRPSTVSTARPSTTAPTARAPGRSVSLPTLPGAQFAATMVTGVQNTASSMVSNVLSFTNGVTKTTNPPPPPSRSRGGWSSGGGSSCA
ncbi:MAG: hypothetical protein KAS19_03380, partial [Anaerolineales bacterium]|nr:hypothetical protein [Anaerolineales bacterium]